MELILSSGFLAFASHLGFLRAVEESTVSVSGLCGTSSGALIGALWLAGVKIKDIAELVQEQAPYRSMRLHPYPWQGLLSMGGLQKRLSGLLPNRFEDLPIPFGVGVCDLKWNPKIVQSGSLLPCVLASCSIPYLFTPISVDGERLCDGGAADRIGAQAWREIRGEKDYWIHVVERSRGAKTEKGLSGANVVRSPRSGASFWSLKDFDARLERTYQKTKEELRKGG
ncbi:MAG: patatin-like phospholipase family protein [Myxococcota bacterium]|nr:patatin-like phospholipase family protein [Myxococcota bacterium]